jgi:hypothetical protein
MAIIPFIRKYFARSDLKAMFIKQKGETANVGRGRKIAINSGRPVLKTKSYTARGRLGMHVLESLTSLCELGSLFEYPCLLHPKYSGKILRYTYFAS